MASQFWIAKGAYQPGSWPTVHAGGLSFRLLIGKIKPPSVGLARTRVIGDEPSNQTPTVGRRTHRKPNGMELACNFVRPPRRNAQRRTSGISSLGGVALAPDSEIFRRRYVCTTPAKGSNSARIRRSVSAYLIICPARVSPASVNTNRRDRRLTRNQNGKRKVVVEVRERDGNSVPQFLIRKARLLHSFARVSRRERLSTPTSGIMG